MKILRYIGTLIFALLIGCSDFTDIQPTHALTPNNAFQKMGDFELLLNGIYSGFQSTGYYSRAFGALPDMMSDNLAENIESLGNYRSTVDWLYAANDGTISGVWFVPYILINNCNILLGSIDDFTEAQTGQRNRIKAQALAIRALAHFDLLRYFGQNYDRNSTSLAVPIKLESSLDRPGRNTVKEVYDQVYTDLAAAKALMSNMDRAINTSTNRSRIDLIVVNAILARVAYYAGDYPTAISSASAVIASSIPLAPLASFDGVWLADDVSTEVIWSVRYLPGDGYVGGDVYFAVNDRVSFKPTLNLLALYNPATDIRYSSYFSTTFFKRPGQLIVSKYVGLLGDGLTNWKAFRMGEMYLIRAEAHARTGGDSQAMSDLNMLRTQRILSYVNENLTGATLLTAIMIERRKELFLEGHRWFDLRIAGQGITRGADCLAPATACSLAPSSIRFVWPIPQDEINANPNIASQQNPGY